MADTKIQKQGEVFISQSEYDALRLAGNLQSNTKYHITKTPETATKDYVDNGFVARIKNTDQNLKCYVEQGFQDGSSRTMLVQATTGAFSNAIIKRDADGAAKIKMPTSSIHAEDIVNRGYVDDGFVAKTSTAEVVYATDSNGVQTEVPYSALIVNGSLALRDSAGHINVANPTYIMHAANKTYVDDNFVAKVTTPAIVYATTATDGSPKAIPWNTEQVPDTLVMRNNNGRIKVGTPVGVNDATTKAYVDGLRHYVHIITLEGGASHIYTTIVSKDYSEPIETIDDDGDGKPSLANLLKNVLYNSNQAGRCMATGTFIDHDNGGIVRNVMNLSTADGETGPIVNAGYAFDANESTIQIALYDTYTITDIVI